MQYFTSAWSIINHSRKTPGVDSGHGGEKFGYKTEREKKKKKGCWVTWVRIWGIMRNEMLGFSARLRTHAHAASLVCESVSDEPQ